MKLIPLTQGKFAMVDDGDYEYLSQFNWHAHREREILYAARRSEGNKGTVYMHRVIMGFPEGKDVHHIDENGLNNQKTNLQVLAKSPHASTRGKVSCPTTSQFKGVTWQRAGSKWMAQIWKRGQRFYLGCFDSECAAALAYDMKAKELFGGQAHLNFQPIENLLAAGVPCGVASA
jgi:hypothetical protein